MNSTISSTQTDHISFTNQDLINAYAPIFARNIRENFSELTEGELPFDPLELYNNLFCFDVFDIITVEEHFEQLIRITPNAYEILKQGWLELVKDFSADLLGKSSHQLADIRKLVDRISAYLDLLYDTYFEISKEFSYTRQHIAQQIPEEIVERFLQSHTDDITNKVQPITLYTRFRGIPIERSCSVISAGSQALILDVDPRMKAALTNGIGVVMIDCPQQQTTYRALYNSTVKHQAGIAFSHLTPLNVHFRHQHIRVEPLFSTSVLLSGNNDEIDARLINISDSGATLYCRTNTRELVANNTKLQMKLELPSHSPTGKIKLTTPAIITRVIENYRKDPFAYRLNVSFKLNTYDDEILYSYISMRQSEILAELNAIIQSKV